MKTDTLNNTDPTGMHCDSCSSHSLLHRPGDALLSRRLPPPPILPGNIPTPTDVQIGLVIAAINVVQAVRNDEATPLPDDLVGENPSGPKGKRRNSGPLTPENGGTGDAEEDFGVLGGGTSEPASTGDGMPDGSQVAPNGTRFRPGTETKGPRIDIPANGDKPHETLHYPEPPLPPTEER